MKWRMKDETNLQQFVLQLENQRAMMLQKSLVMFDLLSTTNSIDNLPYSSPIH